MLANELLTVLQSDRSSEAEIIQSLRALQQAGLSREELVVLVERFRVRNELLFADLNAEENALLALDMIRGGIRPNLSEG